MKPILVVLLTLLVACPAFALRADCNGDGRVDVADLAILAEEWLMSSYPYKINRAVGEITVVFHNKGGTPPLFSNVPNYETPPGGDIANLVTVSYGLHADAEHPVGSPEGNRWRILSYPLISGPITVDYVGSDDVDVVLGNYAGVGVFDGTTAVLSENTDADPVKVRPTALAIGDDQLAWDRVMQLWVSPTLTEETAWVVYWDSFGVGAWKLVDLTTSDTYTKADWYTPLGEYTAVEPAEGTKTVIAGSAAALQFQRRVRAASSDPVFDLVLSRATDAYDEAYAYHDTVAGVDYGLVWDEDAYTWSLYIIDGESEAQYQVPFGWHNDPYGTYEAVAPATGTIVVSEISGVAGLLGSGRMIKAAPMIAGTGLIQSGRMIAK